jgi:hypothetical protein
MELLGDVGHMESLFGPFGDYVTIGPFGDARQVHGLRLMYHRLENHFRCTRWNSLVTCVKWNLVSVHLEIELILTQERCTVCAKNTIGLEMILDAHDETAR